MPKTKIQKQEMLRTLLDRVGRAKTIVFANFGKLGVKESETLRRALKSQDAEYQVVKKTLLKRALKEKGMPAIGDTALDGRIAAVFGYGDQVAPAKAIADFKKENEGKIEFTGGILDDKVLTSVDLEALAKLPSRTELLAKLVGSLNAPISGFVNVLAGPMRSLVYALKALEEKKKTAS